MISKAKIASGCKVYRVYFGIQVVGDKKKSTRIRLVTITTAGEILKRRKSRHGCICHSYFDRRGYSV